MCIIISKEKYGRLPSEEELNNSFSFNSDGAGFMYVENGKVVIDKGYMTYDAFIKHYKSLLQKFNNFKNKSLVIHCRIGTSGKNIKENTHPYPISNDFKKLRSRHLHEDIGVAHNGVIHGYGTKTGLNDTQEFIGKYIYPVYKNWKEFYKNVDFMAGLETITNSKLVFLTSDDELYYVGEFIDDKGLKFSNNSYKYYYSYNYQYAYDDYYYSDDWYYRNYKKQKEIEDKKEDKKETKPSFYKLEKEWSIDIYGDGNIEEVGDKEYYYDYDTMELYEIVNDEFSLIAVNPIIYDEQWREVY